MAVLKGVYFWLFLWFFFRFHFVLILIFLFEKLLQKFTDQRSICLLVEVGSKTFYGNCLKVDERKLRKYSALLLMICRHHHIIAFLVWFVCSGLVGPA